MVATALPFDAGIQREVGHRRDSIPGLASAPRPRPPPMLELVILLTFVTFVLAALGGIGIGWLWATRLS